MLNRQRNIYIDFEPSTSHPSELLRFDIDISNQTYKFTSLIAMLIKSETY